MRLKLAIQFMILALVGAGCGGTASPDLIKSTPSTCPSNGAVIAVGDGTLDRICGCEEAGATVIVPPQPLTCTVSKGAVVFFQYFGTVLQHQIASVGTPSFPTSPVSDTSDDDGTRIHGVQLNETGIYRFKDLMNSALNGQIIVQ